MSNAAKINDQYSMIPIFEDSELVRLARRRWHKRMRRAKHRAPVLLKIAVVLIGCGLFVKSAVVEAFYVPSTSMSPTVKAMDYILVEKFLYGLRVPFVERTVVQSLSVERLVSSSAAMIPLLRGMRVSRA